MNNKELRRQKRKARNSARSVVRTILRTKAGKVKTGRGPRT